MKHADYFLVFDCESVGLHGETFAVGWVILTPSGIRMEEGVFACHPALAKGAQKNRDWVGANVPPLAPTATDPYEVRQQFWKLWLDWKARGALMFAESCWPVEARFLAACVDDCHDAREWEGPYPLHDISSLMLSRGLDPHAPQPRLPDELSVHHPMHDARQSARVLLLCLERPAREF